MTVHGNQIPHMLGGFQAKAAERAAKLRTDLDFDLKMRQLAKEGAQHAQEYVAKQEERRAKIELYCDLCQSFDCLHIPA